MTTRGTGHSDLVSRIGRGLNQIPDAYGHAIDSGLGNNENARGLLYRGGGPGFRHGQLSACGQAHGAMASVHAQAFSSAARLPARFHPVDHGVDQLGLIRYSSILFLHVYFIAEIRPTCLQDACRRSPASALFQNACYRLHQRAPQDDQVSHNDQGSINCYRTRPVHVSQYPR